MSVKISIMMSAHKTHGIILRVMSTHHVSLRVNTEVAILSGISTCDCVVHFICSTVSIPTTTKKERLEEEEEEEGRGKVCGLRNIKK